MPLALVFVSVLISGLLHAEGGAKPAPQQQPPLRFFNLEDCPDEDGLCLPGSHPKGSPVFLLGWEKKPLCRATAGGTAVLETAGNAAQAFTRVESVPSSKDCPHFVAVIGPSRLEYQYLPRTEVFAPVQIDRLHALAAKSGILRKAVEQGRDVPWPEVEGTRPVHVYRYAVPGVELFEVVYKGTFLLVVDGVPQLLPYSKHHAYVGAAFRIHDEYFLWVRDAIAGSDAPERAVIASVRGSTFTLRHDGYR